jgi:hypothetical protein
MNGCNSQRQAQYGTFIYILHLIFPIRGGGGGGVGGEPYLSVINHFLSLYMIWDHLSL